MKKIHSMIMIIVIIFISVSCNRSESNDDVIFDVKLSYGIDIVSGNEEDALLAERFEFNKKDWKEKKLTEKSIKEMPFDYWDVYLENDKVMVATALYYNRFRFDTDNGYFLSKNCGEHGGKIDFIGNDGTSYTILNCNPLHMFSINGDIYLLEGLLHMSTTRGSLYKLTNTEEKWEGKKIADIGGKPIAFTIDKGNIYIIADSINFEYEEGRFLYDERDYKILKVLISEEDTEVQILTRAITLYANSMVKKDNMLYIGLTVGLATVDLNNNKVRFYVKR